MYRPVGITFYTAFPQRTSSRPLNNVRSKTCRQGAFRPVKPWRFIEVARKANKRSGRRIEVLQQLVHHALTGFFIDFYYIVDIVRTFISFILDTVQLIRTVRIETVSYTHLDVYKRQDQARETVSVEIINPSTSNRVISCKVKGEIVGENITFEKTFRPVSYTHLVSLRRCGSTPFTIM